MSQPDSKSASSSRGIYGEKPRANMYTALLIVALLALLFSCLFLILEINYQKKSGEGFFAPIRPAMIIRLPDRPQYV